MTPIPNVAKSTIINMKMMINDNQLLVTKVDKDNSLVILERMHYEKKINTVL